MSKGYVVAVSGGVDSVVLLDILARLRQYRLIVAHFDHGIRPDSAADARFVAALAKKYSLPFEERREELGPQASEERARQRRYHFLRVIAQKHKAMIVTAHHADDIVETIAINIQRGTGWRGLAALGASDIERPLSAWTKQDIYNYAGGHRLEWVEDSTNKSNAYLRNRMRARIYKYLASEKKQQLLQLWSAQTKLKKAVYTEAEHLLPQTKDIPRYLFIMILSEVAVELLQQFILRETSIHLQYPQLERGIVAIKTALPGTKVQLGERVELVFTKTGFVALRGQKML
jgi:tRNA(Ile)-lysidine synthase